MAKRSWRNFDYLLLGVLLALSFYGVVMIYSATIDTDWSDLPQRQLVYLAAGIAVLLVTASIDYRLLEIAQHPFSILTPLILALGNIGLVITWRAGELHVTQDALTPAMFTPDMRIMLVGIALVATVFVLDRFWIEQIELVLRRMAAVAGVLVVAAMGVFFASRLQIAMPYVIVGGVTLVYLLDCLTLRITDILRNPIYVLMLALLGVILVIGQVSGGSQRWLGAGTVQPSEPSKILIIIILAKFLADREEDLEKFSTIIVSLAVVAVPMLLIYLQPDLGTALTMVAIWTAMTWMAGIRFRHLFVLGAAGLAALPIFWFQMEDYMRDRILLFVNPASDPDLYFNVHQALVSIGSGGWTGKGLTEGTQSQLHFLRVRHTDFIFAVTAEELGLLGAAALIGLIFFLLWRMMRVAGQAQDTFGRLLVVGIAAVVLFQSLVNIGMNLGLMPVTGIPLPFISYGGSSFLTLMLGVGLVESVAMRHKKLEFD